MIQLRLVGDFPAGHNAYGLAVHIVIAESVDNFDPVVIVNRLVFTIARQRMIYVALSKYRIPLHHHFALGIISLNSRKHVVKDYWLVKGIVNEYQIGIVVQSIHDVLPQPFTAQARIDKAAVDAQPNLGVIIGRGPSVLEPPVDHRRRRKAKHKVLRAGGAAKRIGEFLQRRMLHEQSMVAAVCPALGQLIYVIPARCPGQQEQNGNDAPRSYRKQQMRHDDDKEGHGEQKIAHPVDADNAKYAIQQEQREHHAQEDRKEPKKFPLSTGPQDMSNKKRNWQPKDYHIVDQNVSHAQCQFGRRQGIGRGIDTGGNAEESAGKHGDIRQEGQERQQPAGGNREPPARFRRKDEMLHYEPGKEIQRENMRINDRDRRRCKKKPRPPTHSTTIAETPIHPAMEQGQQQQQGVHANFVEVQDDESVGAQQDGSQ